MTDLMLIFSLVTQTYNLPVGLLSSVCYVESKHDVSAIHLADGPSSSFGVCQLKLETARWLGYRGTERHLQQDALVNAYYAGKYLRYQLGRYHGDILSAISAYNSGSYRLTKAGAPINRDYTRQVLKAWSEKR